MKFDTLNSTIPYVKDGKKHFFTAQIYPGVEISMPGRHQNETEPVGGDAVVLITDEEMEWNRHQFTHSSLFKDIEGKANITEDFRWAYFNIIKHGADPAKYDFHREDAPGIHPMTFLYASQVLAVVEHRRYAKHEARWGGRFLPFRAAAGIIEGLWDAAAASEKTRTRGRVGIEWLEKDHGVPKLTKELMK